MASGSKNKNTQNNSNGQQSANTEETLDLTGIRAKISKISGIENKLDQ